MRKKVHKKAVRNRRQKQKGSALLVSLMVMVGLSLLGLTFVAVSETESAISVNERNKTQTSALAESGARLAVQWFQQPATLSARGLLPANDTDFKTLRTVEGYEGYYKPGGGETLFDQPYGSDEDDLFYGSEDNADIIVEARNADSTTFLNALNAALYTNDEAGTITSIRVYAPPMVGGTLLSGFWVGGQRYGVATIAATAEKENAKGAVIARSVCRIVIAPFPLPGPTGAVQAIGTFQPNGAYETYWGSIESEQTGETYIKREDTELPRFDPYDIPYIEYGLDSSRVWTQDTEFYPGTFPLGETVRPTDPDLAALYEFTCVDVRNDRKTGALATNEPDWETYLDGAAFWDDNVQWQLRPAVTAYPIATGAGSPRPGYNNHAWLPEVISRSVTDPWFTVRTRGYVKGKNSGDHSGSGPLAMDYAAVAGGDMPGRADDFTSAGNAHSTYFQYQTTNNKYLYRLVDIPTFDYDFWKAAAIAANDEPNVWYLRHTADDEFTDGVTEQPFDDWIEDNEGFLFFDAENNYNPQKLTGAAKTAQLVDHQADPCGARGLIYLNFTSVKTTGCGGDDGYFRQPGEPYRDIGYRRVNEVTSGSQTIREFTTDALGTSIVIEKAYDGKWGYQDLPFSNGAATENGYFDVCIGQREFRRESAGTASVTEWVPLPYFPGCTVGNNSQTAGCNCSEPHEPYLNIRYDGSPTGIAAGWSDPDDNASTYAKDTDDATPYGSLVTCTAADVASAAGQTTCATNAYDEMGARAQLSGNSAPGIVGVLYNEGDYASTGNGSYYGSIVIAGDADPKGTQEVWFDACLVSGCWPPPDIAFPRVMVTSVQIQ